MSRRIAGARWNYKFIPDFGHNVAIRCDSAPLRAQNHNPGVNWARMRIHGCHAPSRKSRIPIIGLISAGSQRNVMADCPNALELRIHTGLLSRRRNPLRFGLTTSVKPKSVRELGPNADSRIPA
eukprot:8969852-Prorocentrum_lima.AAC.1